MLIIYLQVFKSFHVILSFIFSVCSKLICCYCWSCVLKTDNFGTSPLPVCSSITATFWKCLVATAVSWRKFRCAESIRMNDQPIRVLSEKLSIVKKFSEQISFFEKENFTVFQMKFELIIYASIISALGSFCFITLLEKSSLSLWQY